MADAAGRRADASEPPQWPAMSEAARKDYFFIPPGRGTQWSRTPPTDSGLYWVQTEDEAGSRDTVVVAFDSATGSITPPGFELADAGEPPPIPATRVLRWWPARLQAPPIV